MFIGRKKELADLENLYGQDSFRLFVIYGRGGMGKTTLMQEFCKNKNAIFFTASQEESSRANLNRFSGQVLKHFNDEEHEPFLFWRSALSYIKDKQEGSRIVIVIDDFSVLVDRDAAFLSVLKNSIEQDLKDSKILMILSSANVKFVERFILDSRSELFDSISGSMHLSNFLKEETIKVLKSEAVKSSRGVENVKVLKFSADDVLLREGETNSDMYKIISGRVLCYFNYGTDEEYLLGSLNEGSSFGEYSLLTGEPGIYTVVAYSDILVLRISGNDFSKFIEMNASNSVKIMANMAKMLNVMKFNIDMLRDEFKKSDNFSSEEKASLINTIKSYRSSGTPTNVDAEN